MCALAAAHPVSYALCAPVGERSGIRASPAAPRDIFPARAARASSHSGIRALLTIPASDRRDRDDPPSVARMFGAHPFPVRRRLEGMGTVGRGDSDVGGGVEFVGGLGGGADGPFSPCGRRCPDGADEGWPVELAFRSTPHPTSLREATFSHKGRRRGRCRLVDLIRHHRPAVVVHRQAAFQRRDGALRAVGALADAAGDADGVERCL